MKFHDLTVNNFLTIKSATVFLADRGLHLIQGVNEEDSSASSNGAGKSTLVDAIAWCLYGVTAREVTGDAVVNRAVKKNCEVSLLISSGASNYRVTRYRKHATHKNALMLHAVDPAAGTSTDLSRGTDAETQKALQKILGCSLEVFMAAVYSGQEAMPDLPKMKDRELKTLIEEAAGLQRIEKAYEVSRERLRTDTAAAADVAAKLDSRVVDTLRCQESLNEMREKAEQWGKTKADRVTEAENLNSEAAARNVFATATETDLREPKDAAETALAKIDTQLAAHKSLQTAATAAEKNVRTAELAIDVNLLKRLTAQVKLHEEQIANAATEVKKPCSECGTVLETMSVDDYIAHRRGHLDGAKLKLEEGKATIREQVTRLNYFKAQAGEAREAVPDVTALVAEQAVHRESVRRWQNALNESQHQEMNLAAAKSQLALRRSEPNPHQPTVEAWETKLTAAAASEAAAREACRSCADKLEVAKMVVKVFGPAGVRAKILDTVTPFLNAQTSNYLSALSDGQITAVWTTLTKSASGDLKEKFSIDVENAKGGETFRSMSGGEKRKVRIACAMALQDLMASRASQPIDLFIGDEVDDALDPAGLERLMTIFERKARERGTVLLISHSDLKDWCDNVTTVTKSGQWESIVTGSLCSSPS